MTDYNINAVARRAVFSGSAGVGPYAFTFEVLANTDIAVYKNAVKLTLSSDYSVTINSNGTGSVTLTTAATSSDTVTLIGARDIERTTDFTSGGEFRATAINDQLDSLTIFDQQLAEENKRALMAPPYDPAHVDQSGTLDMTLPTKSSRAGKTLAFNATTGNPEAGPDISSVQSVADASADIDTVAGIAANVTTVAGISSDVTSVAGISTNVTTVAGISSNVTTVAGISSNVTTVAGISSDVTTVAADAADIGTVAGISSDVTTVAGQATNMQNITDNLTAVQNAATNATNAASSASAAATSATNAATSETNAGTSETNASNSATAAATSATNAATSETNAGTSETNAATSETNAATSATNAATSATNAATSATAASASQVAAAASAASAASSYDTFDDRYLGVKTSNPTTDNDGDALVEGALYFNSTANEMRVYDGANWIAASSAGTASLLNYHYTATAGQTTFSGTDENSATLSYTVSNLIVTLNGVVLEDGTDYTATNGTSVVLASGAALNDEVNIVAFKSFTTADMVSATNGGTFQNDIAINGDLTVDTNTLFVDASADAVGIGTTTTTDAGVTITNSVTRANSWDAKLALQSTGANDFPALLFSGSNTTQYGGIVGTTDTSGDVQNNRTAQIAFLQSSSTAGNITFSTNGNIGTTNIAERMRIDSGGRVGVGTTSPIGDGIHVKVPDGGTGLVLSGTTTSAGTEARLSGLNEAGTAWHNLNIGSNNTIFRAAGTERARITSDGLTFNGDTAATNALNDYEEGTWTPAIAQGWTSVSYTNSYQNGRYTKVGNMVTAWFWMQFSGTSAGEHIRVSGLPFTVPNVTAGAYRGGAVTYFSVPTDAAGDISAYVAQNTDQIFFYALDDGGASALSNANASSDFLIGSVTYWV